MHNENCSYKDVNAMLYALMEVVEDRFILISAQEVTVFNDYLQAAKENDKDIFIDFETCDKEPYQLVYGALMYHGTPKEEVIEYVNGNKECALINVDGDEFGKIIASSYSDISMYEDRCKHGESIPFVALMQTKCVEEEYVSVTMFPCCDRNVWENLVNRTFLLACRRFVKVDGLSLENWKNYIDEDILNEAYRLAGIYTGETED